MVPNNTRPVRSFQPINGHRREESTAFPFPFDVQYPAFRIPRSMFAFDVGCWPLAVDPLPARDESNGSAGCQIAVSPTASRPGSILQPAWKAFYTAYWMFAVGCVALKAEKPPVGLRFTSQRATRRATKFHLLPGGEGRYEGEGRSIYNRRVTHPQPHSKFIATRNTLGAFTHLG